MFSYVYFYLSQDNRYHGQHFAVKATDYKHLDSLTRVQSQNVGTLWKEGGLL